MHLYLPVIWYFGFHWGMLLPLKNESTKAAIKNNSRAPSTQSYQGDDSMWQEEHFRLPPPPPQKKKGRNFSIGVCFPLGCLLFFSFELGFGGSGGSLSSVASRLFINFSLASFCWPLTPTVPCFTSTGSMSSRSASEDVLPGVQTQVTLEWDSLPG